MANYDANAIQVLEGLEPVRKRPGMYIGSTDERGLQHLITEIVDNSIDEALAGFCNHIVVKLNKDGSCSVEDNGRGIPTGIHQPEGISSVELVLTKLHAGGKFGGGGYTISGGLHGVGLSVVNALSEWLKVDVYQNGKVHHQEYKRGAPTGPLTVVDETSASNGKAVTNFIAGSKITIKFNAATAGKLKIKLVASSIKSQWGYLQAQTLGDSMKASFNGSNLDLTGKKVGTDWVQKTYDWSEVVLGEVDVVIGENTIVLEAIGQGGPNLDCLNLQSAEDLTITF